MGRDLPGRWHPCRASSTQGQLVAGRAPLPHRIEASKFLRTHRGGRSGPGISETPQLPQRGGLRSPPRQAGYALCPSLAGAGEPAEERPGVLESLPWAFPLPARNAPGPLAPVPHSGRCGQLLHTPSPSSPGSSAFKQAKKIPKQRRTPMTTVPESARLMGGEDGGPLVVPTAEASSEGRGRPPKCPSDPDKVPVQFLAASQGHSGRSKGLPAGCPWNAGHGGRKAPHPVKVSVPCRR